MVAVQLLAFAQAAAQHQRAFLHEDVTGEEPLVDGSFGLSPQRLGDDRHQVRGLSHRYRVRLPRGGVLGVAEEEEQPGDLNLRLDADLDIADPGRADLARRADQPDSRAVGGRHGGDDARGGQRASLLRRERQLDARTQLVKLDGDHGSGGGGAGAMALRRPGRPYCSARSRWP